MEQINQKIGEIPNEEEISKGELKKVNEVSIVEEETNTGVNKVLGDTIDYLGNAIPSAVYKKYEIFLELIKDKIEEKDIGENLEIKEDKIVWQGDLELRNLEELPKDIKFPDSIGGSLYLGNLEEVPEDIKFPDSIGGSLELGNLEELPEDIKFPDHIDGSLELDNLKELPEDIKFPDSIGGSLYLSYLEELPKDIRFPDSIAGSLYLSYLEELPKDIKFPDSIGRHLDLSNLKEIPEDIRFPDSIGGGLFLNNLEELPKDIKFPDSIGGNLSLGNLEELPETIKINGDLMLNCNQNLTYLHNNIECKKLYIKDCPKLYTCNNYKIIKYLKDNKKIEAVVGFPRGEIAGMMKRVDNIVVEILSDNDLVVYERYQVFPEDITERLIEESIYILEGVYESVNGYMLSKRDECIALKKTIESITTIEEYKAIDKELDKINKELKDRPRIVRDRLRSIFSKELWEKVVERLKEEDPDMVKFLNKK